MSSSRTSGTGMDLRDLQQGHYTQKAAVSGSRSGLSQGFITTAAPGVPDRFSDWFRVTGIDLNQDELSELEAFDGFLERHVQPSPNRDVQCMLLWSEWVRAFRRQMPGFPDLIHENEFRSAVMGKFGAGIATDGWRGAVYTGVRFLP